MGQPAAKQGDRITATDNHLIQPPGPTSPVIVPHVFSGILDNALSQDVHIQRRPAAGRAVVCALCRDPRRGSRVSSSAEPVPALSLRVRALSLAANARLALAGDLASKGSALVESVEVGQTTVATNEQLVCILEDRSDYANEHTAREQEFVSEIDSSTVG